MKAQYLSREFCQAEIITLLGSDFLDAAEMSDSAYARAYLDLVADLASPDDSEKYLLD